MARALTKIDRNGRLYKRPEEIETAIDTALRQDLEILGRRAWVADPENVEFLPLECLVHILRDAWRRQDETAMRTLMPALLGRCETILKAKLSNDCCPNVAELREDILGSFSLLFIEDGYERNKNELDFYECRFHRAFRLFRLHLLRRERAHVDELVHDEEDAESNDEDALARVSDTFRSQPNQPDRILGNELVQAINNLPSEERRAVVLCKLQGLPEESEDPSVLTAAKLCGVTGRTIRNRLTRAAKKLSQFKKR